ncbi:MAG TPA: hypothetical protein VGR73_10815 [Bryobacteraceae bacterium]|nr:hypothetical protein [Bryobacteraceae bacterium]
MKPAVLIAVAIIWGAATASAAVDPALLDLTPPDAAVLFGLQVQNVLASPFGQYAVAQLPTNNGMVQFAATTGFDYQNDLMEILGATTAPNGTKPRPSLVLARGNFQVTKFLALAAVTGSTLTYYNGTQIISPPNNKASLAFLNASTLAIGSPAALQAAIDRYGAHVHFTGPLAQKAVTASSTSDAWFATMTPASQFANPAAPASPATLLQSVVEASGGVHFSNAGATFGSELTTASAQQAQSLVAVLQLVAAMAAQQNTAPNPQAAQAAALLSGAQFTVNGTALDISVPVPEQQLEQMYSSHPRPANKAAVQ